MATMKKPAAQKAAAQKAARAAVKRTPNAGFMKAMKPSAMLAAVVIQPSANRLGSGKATDIDRPKGKFTDYRNAGDFNRQITRWCHLVISSPRFA